MIGNFAQGEEHIRHPPHQMHKLNVVAKIRKRITER